MSKIPSTWFMNDPIILLQYGLVPSRHELCQFLCPKIRFYSGSPVFQNIHIWNVHVMGSIRMQKISGTNFVWDPVLP